MREWSVNTKTSTALKYAWIWFYLNFYHPQTNWPQTIMNFGFVSLFFDPYFFFFFLSYKYHHISAINHWTTSLYKILTIKHYKNELSNEKFLHPRHRRILLVSIRILTARSTISPSWAYEYGAVAAATAALTAFLFACIFVHCLELLPSIQWTRINSHVQLNSKRAQKEKEREKKRKINKILKFIEIKTTLFKPSFRQHNPGNGSNCYFIFQWH